MQEYRVVQIFQLRIAGNTQLMQSLQPAERGSMNSGQPGVAVDFKVFQPGYKRGYYSYGEFRT